MRNSKLMRFTLGAALATGMILAPSALSSSAAACAPKQPTGKTIGTIKVKDVSLPIKAFNYPAGGVMEPQPTAYAAGLSKRHMPLSSQLGTSVITWHINYDGCWSPLNVLMSEKVGDTFRITDENGDLQRYRIDRKLVVKKGDYKASWFNLVGPRQLALFTCTGEVVGKHYNKNMVFIATPV